jgi:GR25 family glycosyltransferase involved in LPS biosynthesis
MWDWSWLEGIYCINLRERGDRLVQLVDEVSRIGLVGKVFLYQPTRPSDNEWAAFSDLYKRAHGKTIVTTVTRGAFGCWQSHKAVMNHARAHGFKRILVLEDDVQFLPSFTPKKLQQLAQYRLPPGTDFVHLGYFPYTGVPVPPHLTDAPFGFYWFLKSVCTVAYIATTNGMQKILNAEIDVPLDIWMVKAANQIGVFPKVAWQRESPTDVEERWLNTDTTAIKEKGNVFYRNHLLFVDSLILIILPIIIFLLLAFICLRLQLLSQSIFHILAPNSGGGIYGRITV